MFAEQQICEKNEQIIFKEYLHFKKKFIKKSCYLSNYTLSSSPKSYNSRNTIFCPKLKQSITAMWPTPNHKPENFSNNWNEN